MPPQGFNDLLQHATYHSRLIAARRDAEHGELPLIQRVQLGHGHVELVPQAILDAAHHLPLVLEAARLTDEQADEHGTDEHGVIHALQRALYLIDAVRLDHVADLNVVVTGDLQTAFEAFTHLARILLEALE